MYEIFMYEILKLVSTNFVFVIKKKLFKKLSKLILLYWKAPFIVEI